MKIKKSVLYETIFSIIVIVIYCFIILEHIHVFALPEGTFIPMLIGMSVLAVLFAIMTLLCHGKAQKSTDFQIALRLLIALFSFICFYTLFFA